MNHKDGRFGLWLGPALMFLGVGAIVEPGVMVRLLTYGVGAATCTAGVWFFCYSIWFGVLKRGGGQ